MSYKGKTVLCLLVCFLCAVLLQIAACGIPALTPEMALRQEERKDLLGPTQILDTLSIEQLLFDRVTVGRSDYGYTLYYWNQENKKLSSHFSYYPKTGNMTFVSAPTFDMLPYMDGWQYPFFVFTELPSAVRASLQLQLSSGGKTESYQLEAIQQNGCLFLFCLNNRVLSPEAFGVYLDAHWGSTEHSAHIQICLYDREGNILGSMEQKYGGGK